MKKPLALICALVLLISVMPAVFAETAKAPVEITYYHQELGRNAIAYYNDTLWVKTLEERLNIKLKIIGPSTREEYDTAVNVMLVSGEYPDLLYYDWNQYNGGAMAAVEDGIILPISEIPEYKALVPNWFNLLEANPAIRRAVTQDDGSVVTFCHYEPDIRRSAYWGYAIRKDWLDRLNLEVPTTLDELYTVLTAFKTQDANGNGDPNDEIPLTCCNWWTTAHPMMDTMSAAFGVKLNTMFRDPKTGEATFWTEYNDGKNFIDYVTTMRKWYSEGLIDSEYVSQKYDAMAAKITGDKAGMFFCFPDNVINYKASLKTTLKDAGYADPDKVMVYGLVPMKGADGVPYTFDNDNAMVSYAGSNQPTVVTTAAKKHGVVEKCLELINYLYSDEGAELINWGVEGVSFTKDADGKRHWTDLVAKDPDYSLSDAVFKYALPTWGGWPKPMSYEAWGSMNLIDPDAIVLHNNYAKSDTSLLLPSFPMTAEETETYNLAMTDIRTAVSEVYLAVITGTRPLEDLQTLLDQVENMGVHEAIAAYQAAYARYLAK